MRAGTHTPRPPLSRLAGLLLPLVSFACGEDTGIEGTWVRMQFPNNRPCAEQLELDGGDFVSTILCNLTDKQVGTQITAGRYRKADNTLFVVPARSTCPNWPKDETRWTVTANKTTLQRTIDGTIYTFQRDALAITANRVLGCFDESLLNFDEGELKEL